MTSAAQTLPPMMSGLQFKPLTDLMGYRPKFLAGHVLRHVKRLQRSIAHFGLMAPLIFQKTRLGLRLIDGQKRLAALSRLRLIGKLPRTLVRVPCIIVEDAGNPNAFDTDYHLMPLPEMHRHVSRLTEANMSSKAIARALFVPETDIVTLQSVEHLSPRLQSLFHRDMLSLQQVQALITLPSVAMQDHVMDALGPYANQADILAQITRGAKVIALGDDDMLILPSDNPVLRRDNTARALAA